MDKERFQVQPGLSVSVAVKWDGGDQNARWKSPLCGCNPAVKTVGIVILRMIPGNLTKTDNLIPNLMEHLSNLKSFLDFHQAI